MKRILPHIEIGLDEDNRCIVVIKDYELFDVISDYLGDECDLPHEYQSSEQRPGGEIITMYFPQSVEAAAVEECLSRLSPVEIERIYRLNN
ncbi:hypothetical protein [Pseudoduganella albidiflava]|uniref:Uncharacterized protein n=1 Tax=Pseudoduganella albidiflava TaxID=321983 RepID=A0A411X043_9BURK|nr:hypothetical protein [Pseudoduganella albidiflava]QBI02308.1 hypothetical protein EYF70_16765 [Pseudoduganella albidiflava]GGY67099.1 hypothetical protein GCM10007387_56640 [Pseudoduganella albidiflava]